MAMNNLTSQPRPPIIAAWVDQEIGRTGAHNAIKTHFQRLSSFIERWHFFTKPDDLYQFLDDNPKTQIFLIMSGTTAQIIVPQKHQLINIHSMYVFTSDVREHRRLKDDFNKIQDVVNLEEDLYTRIADTLSELLINTGESCIRSQERSLALNYLNEALSLMRNKLNFGNDHGRIRRANDLLESLENSILD